MIYKLLLSLALLALTCKSYGQADPKITIDTLSDDVRQTFQDNSPITQEKLDGGFVIMIVRPVVAQKVFYINPAGTETLATNPDPTKKSIFRMVAPAKNKDGDVEVKMLDVTGKTITVTLKVAKAKRGDKQEDNDGTPNCDKFINEKKKDCEPPSKDNYFGFESSDFTKDDIVYVYDFNKQVSKRVFYKLYLKKNVLQIQKVNMSNETLRPRKQVRFMVANVNKFVYDASIGDTLVDYDSEPGVLFQRLFIGDSTSVLGNLINAFSSSVGGSQKIVQSTHGNQDDMQQLLNDIQCFMTMYNALKAKLLEAYDPCSTFPCCYSIDYSIIGKQLSIVNRDIAVLQLAMAQKRKKLSDDSTQVVDCNKKQATLDKANSDIKAITAKPAASRTSDEKDKLDALNKSLHDLQNAVCPKDQITSLTTEIDQLKLDLQTADVITALQTKLPPEQELRGLVVFINNMVAQNQAVISEPIQMRANRLDITINIRSKDSVTKTFLIPTYNNPSIGLEIPVLWHPFISFSSGSFIATGSYLQNKTYDWQPQANTNNTVVDSAHYILAETGYTPPVMGFSALANLEWKVNRTLGWGLSGGVGLTIETKPRLAYLGGGSIMIGDLRQFTFTGGIAIMQVDKLNNGLQAVADQRIIYTSKPSIGYTKVVKTGGFVALTYTPFKVGKRKLKKAS